MGEIDFISGSRPICKNKNYKKYNKVDYKIV